MTPEQKIITIAEFDGWSNLRPHPSTGYLLGIKPEVGISHIVDIRAEEITNMILATPAQLADALLLTLGYEI